MPTKDEMLSMVEEHFDIEPVEPKYFGEVAKYYRHKDNQVKFGDAPDRINALTSKPSTSANKQP
jgi:molybdenum cofactor biosynthesis enzyme MoaA